MSPVEPLSEQCLLIQERFKSLFKGDIQGRWTGRRKNLFPCEAVLLPMRFHPCTLPWIVHPVLAYSYETRVRRPASSSQICSQADSGAIEPITVRRPSQIGPRSLRARLEVEAVLCACKHCTAKGAATRNAGRNLYTLMARQPGSLTEARSFPSHPHGWFGFFEATTFRKHCTR